MEREIRRLSSDQIVELVGLVKGLKEDFKRNLIYDLKNVDLNQKSLEVIREDVIKFGQSVPRKLTQDEIEMLIRALPPVKSLIDTVGESILEDHRRRLREDLSGIVITPMSLPSLTVDITEYFNSAVIKAGFPVGFRAAEIVGPLTQANLSAFHVSGSKRNTENYGVDRILEVLKVSPNPKNDTVTVYFKDRRLTLNDIFIKKRQEFRQITLEMLLAKDDIQEIFNVDNVTFPYWYENYKIITHKKPKSKWFLRLKLDVNMLWEYAITTAEICQAIEKLDSTICISSPMSLYSEIDKLKVYEAFIDIYPKDNISIPERCRAISEIPAEQLGQIFLYVCVKKDVKSIHIKGVPGSNK